MTQFAHAVSYNLGLKTVTPFGRGASGCISAGKNFETENGPIFVKSNKKHGAETMFRGEEASLRAIRSTDAIICPKPLGVFQLDDGSWALAMTFVEMNGDRNEKVLAHSLANMHLCNSLRLVDKEKASGFLGCEDKGLERLSTTQFGFPIETCCGFLPQPNDWSERWDEFFIRNRLQCQVERLVEKGDRDIIELWPHLQEAASKLLADSSNVSPALVHGDLWSGNWGFSKKGPVVFDPASFYADSEYEQGIINMFGGLSPSFWTEYHKTIPKREGRERRVLLYELYHHLNHWNHFGGGYKSSSLSLIRKIVRKTS